MLDFDAGRWLALLTDAALKSVVVLILAGAVSAGLRRAPAATRHLALLTGIAVLLGLPLLMLFVPRQSLPGLAPLLSKAPAPPAQSIAAPVPTIPVVAPAPTAYAAEAPPAPLPPAPKLTPSVVHTPPSLSPRWASWLVLGWLTGVLLCALRFLAAQARIGRLIRRCPALTKAALQKVGAEAAPFSRLKSAPPGTPPMVWGWPRPTLLLPLDAAQWPEARLRAVILHEATHIRRQDWLTQTLTQAACALYWFNPLIWLTANRMQAEAEQACDDAVLLDGIPAADYAQDLLAVARSLTAARRASLGAVTMARYAPVRNRLEAILDPTRPRRRTTRRAAVLVLAIALSVAVPLSALRPAAHAAVPAAGLKTPPSALVAAPAKLRQEIPHDGHLTDADLDSLIAMLRTPSHSVKVCHLTIKRLFQERYDIPLSQQPKIREVVALLLTSPNESDHQAAKVVLKKIVINHLAGEKPASAPLLSTPHQSNLTGVAPMTPPKNIRTTLLKNAAFATLAASLTLPAVSAPPVPAPKPAAPKPTLPPTDALHWTKIVLQHSTVGTNPALTRWREGGALPEGVKRLFFLTKDNTLLVQATPAGLAQMQAIIKQIDVLPAAQPLITIKVFLQNVVPNEVVARLHSNQGGSLPEGVTQISALPKENALLIVATADGFAKVREIIKTLDVAPRQVQVRVALASVSPADLDALGVNFNHIPNSGPSGTADTNNPATMLLSLDGNIAAQILETFTKKGSVIESPVITTTNNVEADISIASDHSNAVWSNLDTSRLTVTPRINSDDTITLKLHSAVSYVGVGKVKKETQVNTTQEVNTLRTIRSGDTLMLGAPSPQFNGKNDRYLLLFITATILANDHPTIVTVK